MKPGVSLDLCSYRLDEALEPYFSALYAITTTCPEGEMIEDYLHPEWAAIRFTDCAVTAEASIFPGELEKLSSFAATGPTSRALRFALPEIRLTSLGIRAAGWARFVPTPAQDLADKIVGATHPGFAALLPLREIMRDAAGDDEVAAREMNAYLLELHEKYPPVPDRVIACQQALWDPELSEVDEFCERVGVGRRTLERMCTRYFGFPPKKLLRRQRFLRSLGQFMFNSQASWSGSLDGQYFDQAHFVRDFRSFMGMSPSEYAAMPHPLLQRIMVQRAIGAAAAQRADMPTVLRYSEPLGLGGGSGKN